MPCPKITGYLQEYHGNQGTEKQKRKETESHCSLFICKSNGVLLFRRLENEVKLISTEKAARILKESGRRKTTIGSSVYAPNKEKKVLSGKGLTWAGWGCTGVGKLYASWP